MRIKIALLVATCVALAAPSAMAQAPGAPPLPPPPAGPGMPPGPGMAPLPQAYPPPVWSPPASPPQGFSPQPPMMPPPSMPQPMSTATAPVETPQLQLAGRVGFGIGLYYAPGVGYSNGSGALGALGGLSSFGGSLGIRWWVKERLALFPSLNLSVNHSTIPDVTDGFGNFTRGGSFTSGNIAPALSLGYAVYRGKSTRFLVMGGAGMSYTAQQQIKNIPTSGGDGGTSRYVTAKSLTFNLPFGFALEQFFTSKISASIGAQAPLFEYRSTKLDVADATKSVGANFNGTQLNASIYFYTD